MILSAASSSACVTAPCLASWVTIGPLHPHLLFETLAYLLGFALYRRLRGRWGDPLADDRRWSLLVAAAVGAALGSKVLALLQDPARLGAACASPVAFMASGKTIVGGLLGGWLAVEGVKRRAGETRRTGDLFVLPLVLGMAVGRVGCHLSGPSDRTHGSPTRLPWGLDQGDGVARHPVALYEIGFLLALGALLVHLRPRLAEGATFRLFLGAYCAFRVAVDFLKPGLPLMGLTAIQWAATLGLGTVVWSAAQRRALPGGAHV